MPSKSQPGRRWSDPQKRSSTADPTKGADAAADLQKSRITHEHRHTRGPGWRTPLQHTGLQGLAAVSQRAQHPCTASKHEVGVLSLLREEALSTGDGSTLSCDFLLLTCNFWWFLWVQLAVTFCLLVTFFVPFPHDGYQNPCLNISVSASNCKCREIQHLQSSRVSRGLKSCIQ